MGQNRQLDQCLTISLFVALLVFGRRGSCLWIFGLVGLAIVGLLVLSNGKSSNQPIGQRAMVYGMPPLPYGLTTDEKKSPNGQNPMQTSSTPTLDNVTLTQVQNALRETQPPLSFPPHLDTSARSCALRQWTGPDETGFSGPAAQPNKEAHLQALGNRTYNRMESTAQPNLGGLNGCCGKAALCPLENRWESAFTSCPTTFIETPSCQLHKKDDRLWHRSLNDIIQDRSVVSGAEWDPYKHYHSRQKFAQFLAADWVNRKDQYARPISSLDESFCFNQKLQGTPKYVDF